MSIDSSLLPGWKRTRERLKALGKDRRGVAGLEFALIAGAFTLAVVNVTDIAIYLY